VVRHVLSTRHFRKPIVSKLHADTLKLLTLPDVQQNFAAQGFEIVSLGPNEFPQFIRSETRKYEQVVKLANIKVE
jgi:tripartite-type tricarboxylate transporter receptor subunit TctC